MPIRLIDSHCHLTAPELASEQAGHIGAATQAGVRGFILPGVTRHEWQDQLELAKRYKGVYPAAGLHPLFLDSHQSEHLGELEVLCRDKKIVAIGEIGLDYYDGKQQEKKQTELFEQQVNLAQAAGLPVILHVRKAHDNVLAILRKTGFTSGGTVHAYSGSLQQAKQYIDLGFYIGIGGAISYDRAQKRRQLAAQLSLDAIVLETDAPYMQLAGRRDKPNLPQYLVDILDILAELRNEPRDVIAEQTYSNTSTLFRLSDWNPVHS